MKKEEVIATAKHDAEKVFKNRPFLGDISLSLTVEENERKSNIPRNGHITYQREYIKTYKKLCEDKQQENINDRDRIIKAIKNRPAYMKIVNLMDSHLEKEGFPDNNVALGFIIGMVFGQVITTNFSSSIETVEIAGENKNFELSEKDFKNIMLSLLLEHIEKKKRRELY